MGHHRQHHRCPRGVWKPPLDCSPRESSHDLDHIVLFNHAEYIRLDRVDIAGALHGVAYYILCDRTAGGLLPDLPIPPSVRLPCRPDCTNLLHLLDSWVHGRALHRGLPPTACDRDVQQEPCKEVDLRDIPQLNHLQHPTHAGIPRRRDTQRHHEQDGGDVRAYGARRRPDVPPRLLHLHAHVRDARHTVPPARRAQPAAVSRGQAVTQHRREGDQQPEAREQPHDDGHLRRRRLPRLSGAVHHRQHFHGDAAIERALHATICQAHMRQQSHGDHQQRRQLRPLLRLRAEVPRRLCAHFLPPCAAELLLQPVALPQ